MGNIYLELRDLLTRHRTSLASVLITVLTHPNISVSVASLAQEERQSLAHACADVNENMLAAQDGLCSKILLPTTRATLEDFLNLDTDFFN